MSNQYLNANTIVYGNDSAEVTAYVQKIKESLSIRDVMSVFTLSSANYAHLSEIIEKRIRVQKEKENIKYYDSIIHSLNNDEYQRIKALRDQAFEFIRDYNVYELHKFTNITIVVEKCEMYNEFILRVLMHAFDINVFVVVACNDTKTIKPHIRTVFSNIVLLDQDIMHRYVFNVTNLCNKNVRNQARYLLDNGYDKMVISATRGIIAI